MFLARENSFTVWLACIMALLSAAPAWAAKGQATHEVGAYSAMSMGTGWVLTRRHIVTNHHVIRDTKNLRLITQNKQEIPVEVVLVDKKNDLAILSIKGKARLSDPLPLSTKSPRLGAKVFTVGFPHPHLMGINPKITTGHISAMSGIADDPRTYQISVPIQSGNSGGPLLNMRGEVVGIVTSKLSAIKIFEWTGDVPQNVNYAVKVKYLNRLIARLKTNEKLRSGYRSKKRSLESLASVVIDSVVIVAGDSLKPSAKSKVAKSAAKPGTPTFRGSSKYQIAVYSYTEPGNYDRRENVAGSKTITKFSENTAGVLQMNIEHNFGKGLGLSVSSGSEFKKLFYNLENPRFTKSMCDATKARKIIASHSESMSGEGTHFRYVRYRLVDCATKKQYTKRYTIERDERNDGFGYEMALHDTFKDFLIKTPPYISWTNR